MSQSSVYDSLDPAPPLEKKESIVESPSIQDKRPRVLRRDVRNRLNSDNLQFLSPSEIEDACGRMKDSKAQLQLINKFDRFEQVDPAHDSRDTLGLFFQLNLMCFTIWRALCLAALEHHGRSLLQKLLLHRIFVVF